LKFNSLKQKPFFLFPAILCICYFIFPTQNADIDSWYYAACVKHNNELINSHHLIFNIIAYGFYHCIQIFLPNIEAISALNAMNALAASFSLFFAFKIFKQLDANDLIASIFVFLCGASFGFFRFASDAETYILPILFSLISTFFFVKKNTTYNLYFSALFSVLAVLTHQLHIWWTLAMYIYLIKNQTYTIKSKTIYTITLLLIPLCYWTAYMSSSFKGNFPTFILGEYSKGNASIDISFLSLKLSFINFFRTFFQIHGNIYYIFQSYPIICTAVASICIGIVFIAIKSIKNSSNLKSTFMKLGFFPKLKPQFQSLFLWASIFHFVFAFFSSGNAEFMAMLPFLLTFLIASQFQMIKINFSLLMALLLFVWNLSFGVLSNSILNFKKVNAQVQFIVNHPNSFFVSENKNLIENQLTYQYGFMNRPYLYKTNITHSELNELLQKDLNIYTDVSLQKGPISRKELLTTNSFAEELKDFQLQKVDSFENIYGKNFILMILPKK
jgi:hypothetical protein